jgi:benzoyl-CoA reductase/2-hydroxyglutaryl-CoA dehydratase subunit BcrC/BadD/HgdB
MYKKMLQIMEAQTGAALGERGGARLLWFNEWAKFMLRAFEPERKVVYSSLYAFPGEILAAFDVAPFDFELASGMIASTDMGVPLMGEAESRGYSLDVCSFHRISLGASHMEHFPTPDLLVTTSFYCDGKVKTNEILARMHGKESMLLYVPSEISKDSVRYVEKQLRQITEKIGEVAGQRFDEDRLRAAVRSSNRARRSQLKLLDLLKHRPAPWGGNQLVSYSINGQVFTGTEVKERLNEAFLREWERRIEARNLRPERHRIFWFAWIPTYRSNLFEILKERGVSIPLCETFRVHWDEIDEDNPFEGLALKCLKNPFVGPQSRRTAEFDAVVQEYGIDGAILFATPACRQANGGYRVLQDSLAERGIPLLTLNMDISDPRGYSPEQTRTRVESFIEMLDQRN